MAAPILGGRVNMPAVGSTVIDVQRDFQGRTGKLEPIVLAFMEYSSRANRVSITTLLDKIESKTEQELARIERHLLSAYHDFVFDFSTIHLYGRDPDNFVPSEHAVTLIDRRARRVPKDAQ